MVSWRGMTSAQKLDLEEQLQRWAAAHFVCREGRFLTADEATKCEEKEKEKCEEKEKSEESEDDQEARRLR